MHHARKRPTEYSSRTRLGSEIGKASGTQKGAREELVWSRSEVAAQVSIAPTYASKQLARCQIPDVAESPGPCRVEGTGSSGAVHREGNPFL